eukprot:COSAG03_NODE_296_length_9245_cov_95.789744_10_plen_172_part_00
MYATHTHTHTLSLSLSLSLSLCVCVCVCVRARARVLERAGSACMPPRPARTSHPAGQGLESDWLCVSVSMSVSVSVSAQLWMVSATTSGRWYGGWPPTSRDPTNQSRAHSHSGHSMKRPRRLSLMPLMRWSRYQYPHSSIAMGCEESAGGEERSLYNALSTRINRNSALWT